MNSLLNDINYKRLRNPELLQLVMRLVEDYEAAKLKVTDEDLKRLMNRFKQQLQAYQVILEQAKASEKVQEVHQLDIARDRAVRALLDSIKVYRYSEVAIEKKAYHALNTLLKQYKGLLKKGYSEKSGLIVPLLAALKSSEYSDDVQTLNLSKFVTALSDKQQAFSTLLVELSKEQLVKRTRNIAQAREKLLNDYNLLVNYVLVVNEAKENAPFKQLIAIIENSRAPFVTNTLRRQTHLRNRDKGGKAPAKSSTKETLPASSSISKQSATKATEPADTVERLERDREGETNF